MAKAKTTTSKKAAYEKTAAKTASAPAPNKKVSKKTANERITENLVRDTFRELGYYDKNKTTRVEEQKSEIEAAKKLLKNAGKGGGGGKGSPEFIVSDVSTPDFLVIVECKGDIQHHVSTGKNMPVAYAVDGVLHYASFLCKEFNVIAVAVSGQNTDQLHISTYLRTKGSLQATELRTKGGAAIESIIPWADYIEHATFDPAVQRLRMDELMAFSRELHEFMRDYAKLTENEKPLMVSGTLIALQNAAFSASYHAYSPEDLQIHWFKVIKEEIDKAKLPQAKKYNMTQPYSTISVHPELSKPTAKHPKGPLFHLIDDINKKVCP